VPAPIDSKLRAAIIADIQAGKKRNEIARERRVSSSTVSLIAKAEGLNFDRSKTEIATRAVQVDSKARRAALAARLLNKAAELLDLMDEPYLVHSFGGRDNSYNEQLLDRAPASDLRNLMTSAAVAIDKHAVLEKLDVDSGAASAKSMLGELGAALQVAADHMNGTTEGGEG
jgi:hypothetical protein